MRKRTLTRHFYRLIGRIAGLAALFSCAPSTSRAEERESDPCFKVTATTEKTTCVELEISVDSAQCPEKRKKRISLERQDCSDEQGVAYFVIDGELHSVGFEPDQAKLAQKPKNATGPFRKPASTDSGSKRNTPF